MERRERIARLAQSKEDEILLARVCERIETACEREIPAATCFLSKREQMLAAELLRGLPFRFFGGPETAEREMVCCVPEYLDESWLMGEDSPAAALRAHFPEDETLTHRDFLGALMGCGVKRETVGDIYVRPGACDLLVTREIAPFLLENLTSAGRVKLRVERIALADIVVPEQKTKQIRDTLMNIRLDSVVSSGFFISRGKAADYIASDKCELNFLPCRKADRRVAAGDIVTVRGLGKLRLDEVGGTTKKGRTAVVITRFL